MATIAARIARYARSAPMARCPDCGAPLLAAYEEAHEHGLQLVLVCSADCGYLREPKPTSPRVPRRG